MSGRDEALLTLPYLQGYRPARPGPASVVIHLPERVWPGLNLYTSGHAAEAFLLDMEGQVQARWGLPLERFRDDLEMTAELRPLDYFRRAALLPDGDLLAIYEGLGLVRLSPRSAPRWKYKGGAHHDLEVTADGRIFVLDRTARVIPALHATRAVLEDFVTVLDLEGRVLQRVSILEALRRSPYLAALGPLPDKSDVLHTNTIEVLDGRLAGALPAFAAGNLLLSLHELDALVVLDPRREEIVWALKGAWRRQHQPTVLDNGRLLLFDNRGPGGDQSRVMELDPQTGAIGWSYGGPGTDFFSKTLGSSQRLPNGNTLISESENGRAFEITPDGTRVWQFDSPHRAGEAGELVAVLFEMVRYPADFPWRPGAGSAPQ